MKKKIVFIAPHLSTGGMPQYLVKQVESIKETCGNDTSPWFPWLGDIKKINKVKAAVKRLPKKKEVK